MESSGTETTTPKKKWSVKKKVLATAVVLFALGGVGNAMGGDSQSPRPPAQSQASQPKEVSAPQVTTRLGEESKELPFTTITQDDTSLPSSQTQVVQEGKNGTETTTYEITLTDGVQTDKKQVGDPVVVKPIDKIVKNGTYVQPAPAPSRATYYANCTAARAAGAAPVYAGEPSYGTHLDRDRDGVGCE